ncbi:hypothetical protein ACAW49_03195 [Pseudomonas sp. Env-44]|uniref:Uncharacterized protein n=1 Tax=Pseudomonas synxantha TaxID=47883 RepID=A0AAX3I4V1_9PSED|nr:MULTISPECIES: hypothetical protein [Pseudomonas]AZE67770.1 hypothetical protein C4K01_3577 [Pseudomonas synxantha]KRP51491.1 hypothetical protein TU77_21125 [Pseudomonas synxantha]MBK3446171.1 hypothetical protein [Pseudomonas lactis]SDU18717.1 hypothetical protein SAMN05216475_1571 [Pseudomonas synxantha]VTQ97672.1 Uncharacterised protein [Pseudomonas synxantha]
MDLKQRNHQTAVRWIEGEIENLILDLGKPNASAAATSCVTLAFMLRVIDENEHRYFRARIDKIYANYNTSTVSAA